MGEVNIRGFRYFEDELYTDWDNPEKKFKIIILKENHPKTINKSSN